MEKTYLFFDIECANCFDGIGKMCSFGYVLTDESFNVLEKGDIVMNPECEFDWYLFSPKNRCPLAYSKDYFRAQKSFPYFYKQIKKLLESAERCAIGFASLNDVGFLISACERYNLPNFNFSSYDIAKILKKYKSKEMRLSEWCEHYGINLENIKKHKSEDDAMMTMLLTKALCEENKTELHKLLEENKGIKLSVEKYLEEREKHRKEKELKQKINELYGKKCRAKLSSSLEGKNFSFGFKIYRDLEKSYEIAELVFRHGGILFRKAKPGTFLIIEDETESEKELNMNKEGFKTIKVSKIKEITNLENKNITPYKKSSFQD